MADKIINVKIKEAYDTDANQKTKNPVLLKGQMAISSDTRKAKVGDGTHAQLNLPYMNAQHSDSATKATQDASGNVITSTYATKTELSGKADKSHTHDDRYYTESEINTKLNDKANKSHTHDDRYYTKNEIDEKNSKTASVKILASKQSSSAPYTQTVTVNGITSSSLPIPMLDTRNCTDVNNEKTVKREYGYLTYFETSTNQIQIYAKFQKPTVDLTVVFKGV